MDILIKNATIVTQNGQREIKKGDILIQGNKIVEIKARIDDNTEFIIDARGKIALPGLVNTHTHVAMTLFRGYGEDLELKKWLETKIWPVEAKQTEEDAYVASKLGILEMIQSGTTAFNEMCLLGAKEIQKAAEEIGIRATISQGLFDLLPGRDIETETKTMKKLSNPENSSEIVSVGVGPHSIYTCSEEMLKRANDFASKNKLLIHTHLSETRKEVFDSLKQHGKRPAEYLKEIGVMGSNHVFAHASWVTKREIELIGNAKATIATCPVSNLKLATGGICQVSEYDAAGANVTIGTDGAASNNSLNMFESMKLTALLQKHHYWKGDVLTAQKTLDFATINGAKALGLNSGSIETGKLADIVLLDARMPNMVPNTDIISNLVYSAGPQNVTDVIINGKIIVRERKVQTIDEAAFLKKAESAASALLNRK